MAHLRRDAEQRPSPEALLEAARREESRAGKLKISAGAAPGSRHPKRYLDVEELRSHGIHVYSTVNIQHIESPTFTIRLPVPANATNLETAA